ncbi:hypothetical protein PFISCL1PPCAC_2212, partial [Pristionchus fissidentatus]
RSTRWRTSPFPDTRPRREDTLHPREDTHLLHPREDILLLHLKVVTLRLKQDTLPLQQDTLLLLHPLNREAKTAYCSASSGSSRRSLCITRITRHAVLTCGSMCFYSHSSLVDGSMHSGSVSAETKGQRSRRSPFLPLPPTNSQYHTPKDRKLFRLINDV